MAATITHSNGTSVDYSYDALSRLTATTETIDGTSYTHNYAYDYLGRLVHEQYPSGFAIRNQYNAEGFLNKITNNAGAPLWEATTVNEFGNFTGFVLGDNKLSCTQTYDALGFLTGKSAINHATPQATVQNLAYEFSQSHGNLNWRKDLLVSGLEENFDYDTGTETKLESWQVVGSSAFTTNYDNSGNISSKTDAGTYAYNHPTKPHAITEITGNTGSIPSLAQTIAYTAFNKVSTIGEGTYDMEFTYGQDRLRRVTKLYENSTLTQTKLFLGNYEKVTDETTSTEKEYHYLSSPSGLFAVVTRTDGGSETLNYVLTDHLGSIQTITDDEGELPTTFSYGSWGRLRNASTWNYSNPCSLPFFGRGYTGHEHLEEFGLVNMNGRLYDPVLGRMLSPDNFVQMPGNSQNFNRYSYCLNNPLIYTDPDGEWVHLLVGAIIGGTMNLIANADNIDNFGQGLAYFGVGAAAGALGAGVGAGMSSVVTTGGGFGSAFVGGISTAPGLGFSAGAAIGATSGFSSGFVLGAGNAWAGGGSLADGFNNGIGAGITGGLIGGIGTGLTQGIMASKNNKGFWNGKAKYVPPKQTRLSLNIEHGDAYLNSESLRTKMNHSYDDYSVQVGPLSSGSRLPNSYYERALLYEDVPYSLGGESYTGIDCSGLYTRASQSEYRWYTWSDGALPGNPSPITYTKTRAGLLSVARQGDILFWSGRHVAFYAGNGQLFHAHGATGTPTGFTGDLFRWWIPNRGWPTLYRPN